MLKNMITLVFVFYSSLAHAIETENIGFVNCANIVSRWDVLNRANWSNGVTWKFDSKYDLQQKKIDVTATFVANPKISYKLSCNGDMLTIDTN